MNRRELKNRVVFKIWSAFPSVENIKSVQQFRFLRLSALFHFTTIHLREVSQICDDPFTRGQPPISVTGQWRILSNVQVINLLLLNMLMLALTWNLFSCKLKWLPETCFSYLQWTRVWDIFFSFESDFHIRLDFCYCQYYCESKEKT